MTVLRVDLDDGERCYPPWGTIDGRAVWRLDEAPEAIEVALFWHTSGKGTEDVKIVDSIRFEAPGTAGERAFSFHLPAGPYSFSGSLITLAWAVELVALPSGRAERVDVVLAPTPVEVRLTSLGREPRGFSFQLGPGRAR